MAGGGGKGPNQADWGGVNKTTFKINLSPPYAAGTDITYIGRYAREVFLRGTYMSLAGSQLPYPRIQAMLPLI